MADGPPDPSLSSEAEIKSMLTEPSGTASGLDFGEEEKRDYASETIRGLSQVVESQNAATAALTGEVALADVSSAIDRGVDPSEALGAAIASGLVTPDAVDELAWNAALAEQGIDSDEQLYELGDDGLDQQVEAEQARILAQADLLAHQQEVGRVYDQTYEREFGASVQRHSESVAAMKALQHELKFSGDEMRAHLAEIDRELEGGILGPRMDLDALAVHPDPALFRAAIHAVSATLRQEVDEAEAADIRERILAEQHDLADGLTVDGVAVKPPPELGLDPEKFIARVAQRSRGRGPFDGPVSFPASRDIRDGFTADGRKIHPDDLSAPDGSTAKSRLRKELREGRAPS